MERAAGIMSGEGNLAGDAGSVSLPGGAGGLGGGRNTGAAGNGAGPSPGCSGFPGGSSDTAGGTVNSSRGILCAWKKDPALEKQRQDGTLTLDDIADAAARAAQAAKADLLAAKKELGL